MYFTELLEIQDKKIRTQKFLSDVLKIKKDVVLKSEKDIYKKTTEMLTSDMIKKLKDALK